MSDSERRNTFDNILTQSRQNDGYNRGKSNVRSVKRGRHGMTMMKAEMKRSRFDAGVTSRPNVQVKTNMIR